MENTEQNMMRAESLQMQVNALMDGFDKLKQDFPEVKFMVIIDHPITWLVAEDATSTPAQAFGLLEVAKQDITFRFQQHKTYGLMAQRAAEAKSKLIKPS